MYENLGLCTMLFLTLLLAYGNSGSSNHNLSLLIPVIREWILNLPESYDQGRSGGFKNENLATPKVS